MGNIMVILTSKSGGGRMNLFTRPMKLLTAVVLEQKSDAVVKALLEEG